MTSTSAVLHVQPIFSFSSMTTGCFHPEARLSRVLNLLQNKMLSVSALRAFEQMGCRLGGLSAATAMTVLGEGRRALPCTAWTPGIVVLGFSAACSQAQRPAVHLT